MHSAPLPKMNRRKSILDPMTPKNTLESPISAANAHGPKRSPSVLETFSPSSANREAHCDMASSDAPAHTMTAKKSQNAPLRNSCPIGTASPSSTSLRKGTRALKNRLHSGTSIQQSGRIRQFSTPASRKYRVERATTPICPQE